MEQEKYVKVLSRLQAQCARREYCSSDIRAKALKAMDGDDDAAERIVASLVADRFVDDLRYASAFAREKSALAGWGEQKIVFMLSRKGIDRRTAAAALEEVDAVAAGRRLESVLSAKYRLLKDDPQRRLKLLRFALGRGYCYDDVKAAVERLEDAENSL